MGDGLGLISPQICRLIAIVPQMIVHGFDVLVIVGKKSATLSAPLDTQEVFDHRKLQVLNVLNDISNSG